MCSAAHAWMGLDRIVYAVSAAQLVQWLTDWAVASPPVAPLPIDVVAPSVPTSGPFAEFAEEMRALHRRRFARTESRRPSV